MRSVPRVPTRPCFRFSPARSPVTLRAFPREGRAGLHHLSTVAVVGRHPPGKRCPSDSRRPTAGKKKSVVRTPAMAGRPEPWAARKKGGLGPLLRRKTARNSSIHGGPNLFYGRTVPSNGPDSCRLGASLAVQNRWRWRGAQKNGRLSPSWGAVCKAGQKFPGRWDPQTLERIPRPRKNFPKKFSTGCRRLTVPWRPGYATPCVWSTGAGYPPETRQLLREEGAFCQTACRNLRQRMC